MSGRRLLLVNFLSIAIGESCAMHCDVSTTARVHEGNLGQTSDFNWLGVLKVHIHGENKWSIAVSGVVLIKIKYALANADDVSRVPENVFKSDSQLMFLPTRSSPWYVTPASYVTHPEYEYATFSTIAVIELDLDDDEDYLLNPICFPVGTFNTSKYLYLTGYTDEHEKLEKVFYKIQYLDKQFCEDFYNRAGLSAHKRAPSQYVCGYAPYNLSQCVWDNGMALVSNATGYFNLLGFGIRGPGCAAPARFIDLQPYYSWINSVTSDNDEVYDVPNYRRHDNNEFVPIHQLFRGGDTRREDDEPSFINNVAAHDFMQYPLIPEVKKFIIEPTEEEDTIAIFPFRDMWEKYNGSCGSPRVIMYREKFKLEARVGTKGSVKYKLSSYYLSYLHCVCVTLTVKADNNTDPILSFREVIDYLAGTRISDTSQETPEEIFRYYPIYDRPLGPRTTTNKYDVLVHNRPEFIKDNRGPEQILNYDLYIQFNFTDEAFLEFKMFNAYNNSNPSGKKDRRMNEDVVTSTSKPITFKRKYFSGTTRPNNIMEEPSLYVLAKDEVRETFNSTNSATAPDTLLLRVFISACVMRTVSPLLNVS